MAENTLDITLNGEPASLFMSFGLLDKVVNLLGQTSSLVTGAIDPLLRGEILKACLKKRGKTGVIVGEVILDDIEIAAEDALKVIKWASEHAISFFIQAAEQSKALGQKFEEPIQTLQPSTTGSPVSASSTPSAGASTQSQAA